MRRPRVTGTGSSRPHSPDASDRQRGDRAGGGAAAAVRDPRRDCLLQLRHQLTAAREAARGAWRRRAQPWLIRAKQLLDQLRPGDTLVVWKLDRLRRSLRHLTEDSADCSPPPRGQRRRPAQRPSRSDRDCPLDTAGARCRWHMDGTVGDDDDDSHLAATAPNSTVGEGYPGGHRLVGKGRQARGSLGQDFSTLTVLGMVRIDCRNLVERLTSQGVEPCVHDGSAAAPASPTG